MSAESIINDPRGLAVTGSLHWLSLRVTGGGSDNAPCSWTAAGLPLDSEAEGTQIKVIAHVPYCRRWAVRMCASRHMNLWHAGIMHVCGKLHLKLRGELLLLDTCCVPLSPQKTWIQCLLCSYASLNMSLIPSLPFFCTALVGSTLLECPWAALQGCSSVADPGEIQIEGEDHICMTENPLYRHQKT